jgi:hypothetical protein
MKTQKMFYHLILCILADLVKQDKQTFISFAKIKIKAVIYYIKAIRFIRRICIGIVLLILSLVVMICGFIFLHVAFLYYFPLSKEVKALVIFSLGIVYFLVPLGVLLYFTSQRFWMKFSKANTLIQKVLSMVSEDKK